MSRAKRIRTRHVGVYEREITNKHGKPDIAYDITYKVDGRKIWECVGLRNADKMTAGLAARERAKRLDAKDFGTLVVPGDVPTFAEAWRLYHDKHLAGKASEKSDTGNYETHLKAVIGGKLLTKITPLTVQTIKKKLEETPKMPPRVKDEKRKLFYTENPQYLSPKTVAHVINLIGRVYRKCIAWEIYHGRIPTVGVQLEKSDNTRERFLTEEEAQALLDTLKLSSPQWHDIALLSLHTGMRLEEIFSLKVHQVNLESGIIHVMDAKSGTRAAFMTQEVKQMLKEALAKSTGPDAPVFPQRSGGHIRYISSAYTRAVDKLFNEGITDRRHKVVFHTLRHTFGSWLAQKGVPLYTIGELMGHATLEMTKRYAKLSPDSKREAIAKLNGVTSR